MNWIDDIAIPFAQHFEGVGPHTDKKTYAQPYVCPAGKLTVLHGHVILPGEEKHYLNGVSIADATRLYRTDRGKFLALIPKTPLSEAVPLLRKELEGRGEELLRILTREPNGNQLAAFAEFAHNLGMPQFKTSTPFKQFNMGNLALASYGFALWVKHEDPITKKLVVSKGLQRRRRCTQVIFNGGTIAQLKAKNWFIAEYS